MIKKLNLFMIIVLAAATAWGSDFGSSARGTTTAGFLKLGAGARAIALGDAYSALPQDATALYWNPAALTRIKMKSFSFMNTAYLDSSLYGYESYAQKLGNAGYIGAGLQYFSTGNISRADTTGNITGSFSPYDLAVSLGFANLINRSNGKSLFDGFGWGVSAKFIKSAIIDAAQTGALDVGMISPGYAGDTINFAFVLSNLGGKMKFNNKTEKLPLSFKLGSAFKPNDTLLGSFDIGIPIDNNPYAALGTEYFVPVKPALGLAFRAGFNSLRMQQDITGFRGVSFGLGFIYQKLSLDYTFLPYGHLGQTHWFSLAFNF